MARRRRNLKFEFLKEGGDFIGKNKKVVFIVFVICALSVIAAFWLNDFLRTASYFDCYTIEIVKLSEAEGLKPESDFFTLNPKVNIFTADPIALSYKIKENHPQFQDVLITKYLPNRLIATIIDRKAVAKIKVGKYYQVDYEGVVLPQISEEEIKSLPLILGLESQLFNPTTGKVVKSLRLSKALGLLASISRIKEFKTKAVEIVDVSHPENATFKMNGINVILGEAEFERKLELLSRVLDDPKIDKSNVDYVDLRFTDVVVGTKQAKK